LALCQYPFGLQAQGSAFYQKKEKEKKIREKLISVNDSITEYLLLEKMSHYKGEELFIHW